VLLTAFEPYDRWKANASWLTLVQLTQNFPEQPKITTRLYRPGRRVLTESCDDK